ncbi:DUF1579 domain-containing protein [Pelomonas sp. SE-A7]|uniref:DUF1579 domain-containing protein n=1 Tax=Pelomonas sp. SE-A7 TaxID=3054953 RepID=UPI00259CC261|nr:DUF1579 domain-containing protein [Pelomonas sp. SE-A7]MDM4767088.1 DUF1579 domain-containing protein [Pelomonas sp. SE-A7]
MSANPSHDFDFLIGDWRVSHRRLNHRLAGCQDWTEFDGLSSARLVLGGQGNLDENLLHLPGGSYRALTLRSYDPASRTWAIWWLDGRHPGQLDVPVRGGFDADGVGSFYADDQLDGRPIRVRFLWLARTGQAPRWEQAFSADGGQSWETNWTMDFHPQGEQ